MFFLFTCVHNYVPTVSWLCLINFFSIENVFPKPGVVSYIHELKFFRITIRLKLIFVAHSWKKKHLFKIKGICRSSSPTLPITKVIFNADNKSDFQRGWFEIRIFSMKNFYKSRKLSFEEHYLIFSWTGVFDFHQLIYLLLIEVFFYLSCVCILFFGLVSAARTFFVIPIFFSIPEMNLV